MSGFELLHRSAGAEAMPPGSSKGSVFSSGKVAYVMDPRLMAASDSVPVFEHRATMTHSLIAAFGLTDKMHVMSSRPARESEVRLFHSEEYVGLLQAGETSSPEEEEEYGLGFDCPVLPNLWQIVCHLAGGTLTAADALVTGRHKVAINWCGGWHHAQRDSAAGFCYVNDIVLAIRVLQSKFEKILYIDLDVHHGFITDNGVGKGRHFALNIPYKSGINNQQFVHLFESVLYPLCEVLRPQAVVCQCGGDALAGDPIGGANLTPEGYRNCVQQVLYLNKPTLFLGGGGYNKVNTAKLWTHLTAQIINETLPSEIPEHDFFSYYGPSFEMEVTASLRRSENSAEYIDDVLTAALENIGKLTKLLEQPV